MAMLSSTKSNYSNNNYHAYTMTNTRNNIRASCYAVDAATESIQGFHYSSTFAGGAEWYS